MKRWLAAFALALASLAALGPLIHHFDLSRLWRLRLTRDDAIAAARALTQAHGIDTGNWSPLCRTTFVRGRAYLEITRDGRPAHPLFTPAQYEVSLLEPSGQRWIKVLLNSDGRPVSLQQSAAPGVRLKPTAVNPAALLTLYTGDFERSFQRENEAVAQGNTIVDSWAWGTVNAFESSARFEVVREQGAWKSVKLEPRLPAVFIERLRNQTQQQQGVLVFASIVAITLLFAAAFPLFFRGLVRRHFPSRLLLPAFGFFFVLILLGQGFTIPVNGLFVARETFSSLASWLSTNLLGWAFTAVVYMLFYGAGRTLLADADLSRWFSFESLLRGNWLVQPVGASLTAGTLCGFTLAVLPFAGLVLGPPALPGLTDIRDAGAPWPVLAAFRSTPYNEAAALILLVLPWRRRFPFGLGWLLYAAMGAVLTAFARNLFDTWLWPSLLAGLAVALGLAAIYLTFDLLTVLVAHLVMASVTLAVTLSFQPAGMRIDALQVMSLPLAFLLSGLALLWRGQRVDIPAAIENQKAALKEAASDNDRLRAEFSVARKAQLGMLPEVPERIGQTGLAALCHPAREVGGDLYDFFPCADGRYAICVADVSGKGVPASLYMSLTKGIMSAASLEATAIPDLLGTLNKHLVAFGRRRIFVTMALGYYNPSTRVLEHARAGHNPVLVWSARTRKTEFLQPRGVGLGMAGPAAFAKTLQVDRVTLEPDDIVVFYSDGIVEAMNMAKEQFGEDRLLEAVQDCAGFSATGIAEEIERRVRLFAGAAPVHDDQTLFVLRVG